MNSTEAEDAIAKQLDSMRVGVCVRARSGIVYAAYGLEIEPGAIGVIEAVSHHGAIVGVRWGGEREPIATMFSVLEVIS